MKGPESEKSSSQPSKEFLSVYQTDQEKNDIDWNNKEDVLNAATALEFDIEGGSLDRLPLEELAQKVAFARRVLQKLNSFTYTDSYTELANSAKRRLTTFVEGQYH